MLIFYYVKYYDYRKCLQISFIALLFHKFISKFKVSAFLNIFLGFFPKMFPKIPSFLRFS